MRTFVALLIASAVGCRTTSRDVEPRPIFADVYGRVAAAAERPPDEVEDRTPGLTLRADAAPLREVLALVSRKAGVSIVTSERIDGGTVTLDVYDAPVGDVLGVIARRLGVEVVRAGSVFYLGELKPEDRAVLVRRVRRLSRTELEAACLALMSENGRVAAHDDGLLVVADRVEVVGRVVTMLDDVEATATVTWAVQLHLVSLSERDVRDIGIDAVPAVRVAASFAAASASGGPVVAPLVTRSVVSGGLDAVLRAVETSESGELVAEPFLLLGDGESGRVRRGRTFRVPQRTVSDNGTVTTTGFEPIEEGVTVDVGVRELGDDSARLRVTVDLSTIESLTDEGIPVLAGESWQGRADVRSGGVYLLGSLELLDDSTRRSQWLQLGERDEGGRRVLQVWARVLRVGGPVDGVRPAGLRSGWSAPGESDGTDPVQAVRVDRAAVDRVEGAETRSEASAAEDGAGGSGVGEVPGVRVHAKGDARGAEGDRDEAGADSDAAAVRP